MRVIQDFVRFERLITFISLLKFFIIMSSSLSDLTVGREKRRRLAKRGPQNDQTDRLVDKGKR